VWKLEQESHHQREEFVPTDRLCFSLVQAALSLATRVTSSSRRNKLIQTVFDLHSGLLRDLDTLRDGDRLILHTVPAIFGLSRAVQSSSTWFKFLPSDPYPTFPPCSTPSTTLLQALKELESSYEEEEEEEETLMLKKSIVQRYSSQFGLLFTSLVGPLSGVELLVTFWSDLALNLTTTTDDSTTSTTTSSSWSKLVSQPNSNNRLDRLPSSSLDNLACQTFERALQTWEEVINRIEAVVERRNERQVLDDNDDVDGDENDELENETLGAGTLLEACLRLSTITSSLSSSSSSSQQSPRNELISILESLLLPSSLPTIQQQQHNDTTIATTTSNVSLQLTALESIRLLSRSNAFSGQKVGLIELVKEFLTSSELGRWTAMKIRDPYNNHGTTRNGEGEERPCHLVKEAAETWISLVSFLSLLFRGLIN